MRCRKIIMILIINIMLIGIIYKLTNKDINIIKEKQIIKEMTNTEYESQILELNNSHTEYALKVQTDKQKIASAITEMGIETSENASADIMATNIKNITNNKQSYDILSTLSIDDFTSNTTSKAQGLYVNGKSIGNGNISADYPLCFGIGTGSIMGNDSVTYTGNKLYDLTGYETICFYAYCYGWGKNSNQHTYIQLVSAEDSSNYITLYDWYPNGDESSSKSTSRQLVDISNLTGEYYLKMYSYRNGNWWSYIAMSYLALI